MAATASVPLSLRYQSDQLGKTVLHNYEQFYRNHELCDIVLNIGGVKLQAHRVVLAACSQYLRDLFGQPSSSQCSEITLRSDLHADATQRLVEFFYTQTITVDSQSAEHILFAARVFQIREIEKLCVTFLAAQQALRPEGCLPEPVSLDQEWSLRNETLRRDSRGSHSRELVCADTSGIGSTHTSPRHSSRPSSVPSGNGSVIIQTQEDGDTEVIEVKQEQDMQQSASEMSPHAGMSPQVSGYRPLFPSIRSAVSSFPGLLISTTSPSSLSTSTLLESLNTSPSASSPGQILAKALNQSTSPGERTELRELEQIYAHYTNVAQSSQADGSRESLTYGVTAEICHLCQQMFTSSSALKRHMTSHREILNVPSSYGQKSGHKPDPKDPKEPEYEMEFPGGRYQCGTCGKCFRDPQSLKFHRYNHVLRFTCNFCGKRFSRSWNLARHRKTHYRYKYTNSGITVIDDDDINTGTVSSEGMMEEVADESLATEKGNPNEKIAPSDESE